MLPPTVRLALPTEYELLADLYWRWGYRAGIAPADVVFVCELGDSPVGLVRRSVENGVTMLRGMYVDPSHHGRGLGTLLLEAFVTNLPRGECFCVPLAHLTGFYERGGFRVLAEQDGPSFLRERLTRYRHEGHEVLLMRRPADE